MVLVGMLVGLPQGVLLESDSIQLYSLSTVLSARLRTVSCDNCLLCDMRDGTSVADSPGRRLVCLVVCIEGRCALWGEVTPRIHRLYCTRLHSAGRVAVVGKRRRALAHPVCALTRPLRSLSVVSAPCSAPGPVHVCSWMVCPMVCVSLSQLARRLARRPGAVVRRRLVCVRDAQAVRATQASGQSLAVAWWLWHAQNAQS